MKKSNHYYVWIRSVAFILIAGTMFSFGYSLGNESAILQNDQITLEAAKQFYNQNGNAQKAILINAHAINTMKAIMSAKSGASGVRLYFGKDQNQKAANFMVPVNGDKDDVSLILRTNGTGSTCPNFCDKESPISK